MCSSGYQPLRSSGLRYILHVGVVNLQVQIREALCWVPCMAEWVNVQISAQHSSFLIWNILSSLAMYSGKLFY